MRVRLGARRQSARPNSLLDINVFGRRAGIAAADYANATAEAPPFPADASAALIDTVERLKGTVGTAGAERIADLRKALQETMDRNCQVFRTADSLAEAAAEIAALKQRYANIAIHDRGARFNTDLLEAMELSSCSSSPRSSSPARPLARRAVAATTARTSPRVTTRSSCYTPWRMRALKAFASTTSP